MRSFWPPLSVTRAAGHPCRRRSGFTLVEMLTVMTILGVLAALAAPSFARLTARQRAGTVSTDLYITLVKARSEAIKRSRDVTLSPNTSGQWASGWRIPDPDDADETRVLDQRGAIGGATITGPSSVTYQSNGRVRASTPPVFDISISGESDHQCVSIDLSGRPYQKKSSASC